MQTQVTPSGLHTIALLSSGQYGSCLLERLALSSLIDVQDYNSQPPEPDACTPVGEATGAQSKPVLTFHMGASHGDAADMQQFVAKINGVWQQQVESLASQHESAAAAAGISLQDPAGILIPKQASGSSAAAVPLMLSYGPRPQLVLHMMGLDQLLEVLKSHLVTVKQEQDGDAAANAAGMHAAMLWSTVTDGADAGLHALQCSIAPDMYRAPVEDWVQRMAGVQLVMQAGAAGQAPDLPRQLLWLFDVIDICNPSSHPLNARQVQLLHESRDQDPLCWGPWHHLSQVCERGDMAALATCRAALRACTVHMQLQLPCPLLQTLGIQLLDLPADCLSQASAARTPLLASVDQVVLLADAAESLAAVDSKDTPGVRSMAALVETLSSSPAMALWYPTDASASNTAVKPGQLKAAGPPLLLYVLCREGIPLHDSFPALSSNATDGKALDCLGLLNSHKEAVQQQLGKDCAEAAHLLVPAHLRVLLKKKCPPDQMQAADKLIAQLEGSVAIGSCMPIVGLSLAGAWHQLHSNSSSAPEGGSKVIINDNAPAGVIESADMPQGDGGGMTRDMALEAQAAGNTQSLECMSQEQLLELLDATNLAAFLGLLARSWVLQAAPAVGRDSKSELTAAIEDVAAARAAVTEVHTKWEALTSQVDGSKWPAMDASASGTNITDALAQSSTAQTPLADQLQAELTKHEQELERQLAAHAAAPLAAFLSCKLYQPRLQDSLWSLFCQSASDLLPHVSNQAQEGSLDVEALRAFMAKALHMSLRTSALSGALAAAATEAAQASNSMLQHYTGKLLAGMPAEVIQKMQEAAGVHGVQQPTTGYGDDFSTPPKSLEELAELAIHWQVDMSSTSGDLAQQRCSSWDPHYQSLSRPQQLLLDSVQQGLHTYLADCLKQKIQMVLRQLAPARRRVLRMLGLLQLLAAKVPSSKPQQPGIEDGFDVDSILVSQDPAPEPSTSVKAIPASELLTQLGAEFEAKLEALKEEQEAGLAGRALKTAPVEVLKGIMGLLLPTIAGAAQAMFTPGVNAWYNARAERLKHNKGVHTNSVLNQVASLSVTEFYKKQLSRLPSSALVSPIASPLASPPACHNGTAGAGQSLPDTPKRPKSSTPMLERFASPGPRGGAPPQPGPKLPPLKHRMPRTSQQNGTTNGPITARSAVENSQPLHPILAHAQEVQPLHPILSHAQEVAGLTALEGTEQPLLAAAALPAALSDTSSSLQHLTTTQNIFPAQAVQPVPASQPLPAPMVQALLSGVEYDANGYAAVTGMDDGYAPLVAEAEELQPYGSACMDAEPMEGQLMGAAPYDMDYDGGNEGSVMLQAGPRRSLLPPPRKRSHTGGAGFSRTSTTPGLDPLPLPLAGPMMLVDGHDAPPADLLFQNADDEAFSGLLKVLREMPEDIPYIPYRVVCSIMSGSGSKLGADHHTRTGMLRRCCFRQLSSAEKLQLVTQSIQDAVAARQRTGRALPSLDDTWYSFEPPVPAEPLPRGVRPYDWALHWIMLDVALLRYGWHMEQVDTSQIRMAGRDFEGTGFNWYTCKNGLLKQHGELSKAVASVYGIRYRRPRSRPENRQAKAKRIRNDYDEFVEFYGDEQLGAETLTLLKF